MTPRIVYAGFPAALLPEIRGILSEWGVLLPAWCIDLRVVYDARPPADDLLAETRPLEEYGRAEITIYPRLFERREDAERVEHVVHELLHIAVAPLADAAAAVLDCAVEENSPARRLADEQLRRGEERACQDLARAIVRRPKPKGRTRHAT